MSGLLVALLEVYGVLCKEIGVSYRADVNNGR